MPHEARGESHCGLAIYNKKYLKANEDSWKLKYFSMQKYIIFKKSSKRNQILQDIIITLSLTQAKISSFKNPHIKIDLLLLPRGQNPLSYYTL
jgi:hypothetical protein